MTDAPPPDSPAVRPAGREALERIAFEGASVALGPADLEAVAAGRRATLAALAEAGPVYGVTTGQGFFAGPASPTARPPATSAPCCWAAPSARPRGWSPARRGRCWRSAWRASWTAAPGSARPLRLLADRLNDGFTPAIPRAAGCAGEVVPLAHAFPALVGVGRARRRPGRGRRRRARGPRRRPRRARPQGGHRAAGGLAR